MDDIKAIDRVVSLLELLKVEGDTIFKIIGLVQDNPDFFKTKLGGSCLQSALTKLKKLTDENKA